MSNQKHKVNFSLIIAIFFNKLVDYAVTIYTSSSGDKLMTALGNLLKILIDFLIDVLFSMLLVTFFN